MTAGAVAGWSVSESASLADVVGNALETSNASLGMYSTRPGGVAVRWVLFATVDWDADQKCPLLLLAASLLQPRRLCLLLKERHMQLFMPCGNSDFFCNLGDDIFRS